MTIQLNTPADYSAVIRRLEAQVRSERARGATVHAEWTDALIDELMMQRAELRKMQRRRHEPRPMRDEGESD